MKKILVFLGILSFSFSVYNQNRVVPKVVVEAFNSRFTSANNLKWELEDDKTAWEADFSIDEKSYSAEFDNSGNWLETEIEIDESEVPEAVAKSFAEVKKSTFPNSITKEIEKVENPKGVFYEFDLMVKQIGVDGESGEEIELTFDASLIFSEAGKLLEESEEEGEEE